MSVGRLDAGPREPPREPPRPPTLAPPAPPRRRSPQPQNQRKAPAAQAAPVSRAPPLDNKAPRRSPQHKCPIPALREAFQPVRQTHRSPVPTPSRRRQQNHALEPRAIRRRPPNTVAATAAAPSQGPRHGCGKLSRLPAKNNAALHQANTCQFRRPRSLQSGEMPPHTSPPTTRCRRLRVPLPCLPAQSKAGNWPASRNAIVVWIVSKTVILAPRSTDLQLRLAPEIRNNAPPSAIKAPMLIGG